LLHHEVHGDAASITIGTGGLTRPKTAGFVRFLVNDNALSANPTSGKRLRLGGAASERERQVDSDA
jgi:hypothetical protein